MNVSSHVAEAMFEPSHKELISDKDQHDSQQDRATVSSYHNKPSTSLSYLHHLLEDEEYIRGDITCNIDFMAYQAKASELAAILEEDSPGLSLNVISRGQDPSIGGHQQQLDMYSFLTTIRHLPESVRRMLLLNKLRGVEFNVAIPLNCMPSKALDVGLFRHLISRPLAMPRDHEGKAGGEICITQGDRKAYKPLNTSSKLQKGSAFSCRRSVGKALVRAPHEGFVDLNDLLLRCANAVGASDTKAANALLTKVKQHADRYGNGGERLGFYFAEALDARLSGTGWQIYLGVMQRHRPSPKQILSASLHYMSSCPVAKAARVFVNQTILGVSRKASTLTIIEHQMTGFQYPSLFKELAARPGGPPQVWLVGGNVPHYSMTANDNIEVVLEALEEAGRRLSACAASYGIPFKFTAWAGKIENFRFLDYACPDRSRDEVLVLLGVSPLRYIMDISADPTMVRTERLKMVQTINADVYVQGIVTGSYSTPFFLARFREALFHFERVYDMLDTFIERDDRDRMVFESEILGKALLNIVACESTCMSQRVDGYKQWKAVSEEAGLQQLPLNQELKGGAEKILKSCHKDYTVGEDGQYLLMGWKGRMLYALSTWKGSTR